MLIKVIGVIGRGAAKIRRLLSTPILISVMSTVLIQLANVITGILLARTLGPALRGNVATLTAFAIGVSVITGLSFSESTIFYAARFKNEINAIVGNAAILTAFTALAGVLLGACASRMVPNLRVMDSWWHVLPWILYPAAAHWSLFAQTITRSIQNTVAWFWMRVFATWNYAILLGGCAIFYKVDANVAGICLLMASLVNSLVGLIVVRRRLFPLEVSGGRIRDMIQYSLRLHPASIAAMARDQMDKIILAFFVAPAELGQYVVAIAVGSLIVSGTGSIEQIMFPSLARVETFDDRRHAYLSILRRWAVPGAAAMLLAVFVSPLLARTMFGAAFTRSGVLIMSGAAVGALQSIKILSSIALKIEARTGRAGAHEAIGVGTALVLIYPVVSYLGINGAPLASGCGAAASLGLNVMLIWRLYGARAGR